MQKGKRVLTVISSLFIVFGLVSALLSVWQVFGAAYRLYTVGFWGGFVTAFTALFNIVYASLVVAGGFMGLFRKKLDFCFKLGVLMVFFAVVRIVMEIPRYMLGEPVNPAVYIQAALNIAVPIIFVRAVSAEQKRRAAKAAETAGVGLKDETPAE